MVARERARCFFSVRLSSLRSSLLLERFSACMCVCVYVARVSFFSRLRFRKFRRGRGRSTCAACYLIFKFSGPEREEKKIFRED